MLDWIFNHRRIIQYWNENNGSRTKTTQRNTVRAVKSCEHWRQISLCEFLLKSCHSCTRDLWSCLPQAVKGVRSPDVTIPESSACLTGTARSFGQFLHRGIHGVVLSGMHTNYIFIFFTDDTFTFHNKRGTLMMAEFHKCASVSGSQDCSLSCLMGRCPPKHFRTQGQAIFPSIRCLTETGYTLATTGCTWLDERRLWSLGFWSGPSFGNCHHFTKIAELNVILKTS